MNKTNVVELHPSAKRTEKKRDKNKATQRAGHVSRSIEAYNIAKWSDGFFSINEKGKLVVKFAEGVSVPLSNIAAQVALHDVTLPVVLRFSHIIFSRVEKIFSAFTEAMYRYNYQGDYTLVYPIKVNQQRSVVESVMKAHLKNAEHVGLEVGTKAELMIALSVAPKGSRIVCNGYKDLQYIQMAIMGQQLGHSVYIVIEKPSEAALLLQTGKDIPGALPLIGVRAQLSIQAKSAWCMTSGEKAKFGLNATQLLDVVSVLKSADALHYLQLLHVHIGSQLVNIEDIGSGLFECCRFFAELLSLGAAIDTIDFGGGLAIDYEGTQSDSTYSMNYNLQEYAGMIIKTLAGFCQYRSLPMPNVFTESGRAQVAHHAVLLTNVVDVEEDSPRPIKAPRAEVPELLHELWKIYKSVPLISDVAYVSNTLNALQECLQSVVAQYNAEHISLAERAYAEDLIRAICQMLYQGFKPMSSEDIDVVEKLHQKLAKQCHVNFSLFQSLPDAWGIDQVFPVMPLAGLDQPLTQRVVVSDMTCDSEGSMASYVADGRIRKTLSLPAWSAHQPKLLAFFLVGAYQDILGSDHNLLGETAVVDVSLNDMGEVVIGLDKKGDCISDVLLGVDYPHEGVTENIANKLAQTDLSERAQEILKIQLQQSLYGNTYLQGV